MKLKISSLLFLVLLTGEMAFSVDTVTVDCQIVWSLEADSATDMKTLSKALVETMNLALHNSAIPLNMRLVYAGKINYREDSISSAKSHDNLKSGVGALKEVHDLRNKYGADLNCLVCVNSGVVGRSTAWGGRPNPANAFTTCRLSYLKEYHYILAHEFGHELGCGHENGAAGAFKYSRAKAFTVDGKTWRTLMYSTVSKTNTALHYSNPSVLFNGVQTGVVDSFDNARTIRELMAEVAKYRTNTTPAFHPFIVKNDVDKEKFTLHNVHGFTTIKFENPQVASLSLVGISGRSFPLNLYKTAQNEYRIPNSKLTKGYYLLLIDGKIGNTFSIFR